MKTIAKYASLFWVQSCRKKHRFCVLANQSHTSLPPCSFALQPPSALMCCKSGLTRGTNTSHSLRCVRATDDGHLFRLCSVCERDKHKSDRTLLISARHSVRYGWRQQHHAVLQQISRTPVRSRFAEFAAHPCLANNDDETRPPCLRVVIQGMFVNNSGESQFNGTR